MLLVDGAPVISAPYALKETSGSESERVFNANYFADFGGNGSYFMET